MKFIKWVGFFLTYIIYSFLQGFVYMAITYLYDKIYPINDFWGDFKAGYLWLAIYALGLGFFMGALFIFKLAPKRKTAAIILSIIHIPLCLFNFISRWSFLTRADIVLSLLFIVAILISISDDTDFV